MPSSASSTGWNSNTPSASSSCGEPHGARPRGVDERPPHPRLVDEPDHQRATVRTEALGLDHFFVMGVPYGDLVTEAGRVDARRARRRRPERRADRVLGVWRHREVVHVRRTGLARIPIRPGAEVVDELAGPVVDLDNAAGLGLVVRRADHRCQQHPVHRHHAVRDGVAAVGDEVLVHRAERHRRAVSIDVEHVDPVREQPWDDQALLVGGVPEVVQLVADVGHVDAVDDLAKVGLFRIGADHGDEVGVAGALGDRGHVEEPLLLVRSVRCDGLRGSRQKRDRNQRAGCQSQPGDGSSTHFLLLLRSARRCRSFGRSTELQCHRGTTGCQYLF